MLQDTRQINYFLKSKSSMFSLVDYLIKRHAPHQPGHRSHAFKWSREQDNVEYDAMLYFWRRTQLLRNSIKQPVFKQMWSSELLTPELIKREHRRCPQKKNNQGWCNSYIRYHSNDFARPYCWGRQLERGHKKKRGVTTFSWFAGNEPKRAFCKIFIVSTSLFHTKCK